MNTNELFKYGLTKALAEQAGQNIGLELGRVIGQNRTQYLLQLATERISATVAGRLENLASGPEDFPAVGDWVWVLPPQTSGDLGIIQRLVTRTSVFTRKAAGRTSQLQVVAANVDVLLLCMAMDHNFNVRRLERYLSVAHDSGAQSAIVLTKTDLATDLTSQMTAVRAIAGDVPVLTCHTQDLTGWQAVSDLIEAGKTYALLGSSGVGKSTLINHLLGRTEIATAEVRASDAHGRHTTTGRQLLTLPSGGIVIDTPGMRELSIMTADIAEAFTDITQLAIDCKFRNCTHQQEPGCAVQIAIQTGELDLARLESYEKLQREQVDNELRGKSRENAKIQRMFGSKKNMKAVVKASRERHLKH